MGARRGGSRAPRRLDGTRILGEHFKADGTPKRPFKLKADAVAFTQRFPKQNLTVYRCSFCRQYHLATRK